MKKKAVILGVCAISLIIVIAAAALALVQNQVLPYSVLLERGDRYLNAGDYNQAVVVYKRAISEKPMQPDGYIGLARAYAQLDKKDLAVVTLGNGYKMTHSLTIRLRLEELDPEYFERLEQGYAVKSVSENPAMEEERQVSGQDISINSDLMSFMATASYEDYQKKFGNLSRTSEGNVCILRISSLNAAVRFYDTDTMRILDSTGTPFRECLPNEIVFQGLAALFGDLPQISYEQLHQISQITNLQQNGEKVTFTLCGCKLSAACDDAGTIQGDALITLVPTGENQKDGRFHVSGRVIDATTGTAVSEAKVQFCISGGVDGDTIVATTSSSGFYEILLSEAGMYNVKIRKNGYIEEATQVYLTGGATEEYRDFTISQVLQTGEIRLVLTWGEYPTDLDSYLSGSTDSGERVDVSYHSKYSRANGNTLAELDVDDMDGYGPETITLYDLNGVFEYYIKDYHETGKMGNSGAQVKIYKGDSLVRTINISGDVGNTWYVCTIDHGNII